MPLPKPDSKEKEADFISRCMSSDVMKSDYSDTKQRTAICYSQWRNKEKLEEQKLIHDYKLDTKENVREALEDFSKTGNRKKYSKEDQKTIWQELLTASKKHNLEVSENIRETAGLSKQRVRQDMSRLQHLYDTQKPVLLGDIQIPYTIYDVILHAEGEFNGKYYPSQYLADSAWQMKGLPIYLDHDDNMSNLVGEISEAYYDPQRKANVGDITFLDKDLAQKISYFKEKDAKFRPGLSPTVWIDEYPMPDGRIEARNLDYVSMAVVTEPAQGNLARLSKEKQEVENMTEQYVSKDAFIEFEKRMTEKLEASKPSKKEPKKLSVEDISEEELRKHPLVQKLEAQLKTLQEEKDKAEEADKAEKVDEVVETEVETGLTTEETKAERKEELKGKPIEAIEEAGKAALKVKEALSKMDVKLKGDGVQTSRVKEELGGKTNDIRWEESAFAVMARNY